MLFASEYVCPAASASSWAAWAAFSRLDDGRVELGDTRLGIGDCGLGCGDVRETRVRIGACRAR